ncbi:MAG TPA: peroxiredoxin family protein [Bacteroidia bacterium]|jgi:peroxiredoxin Q/BCP|nr:peroxiredoxin family protein [Bacteroidia bacterium]
MHRSTPPYIIGTALGVVCLVLTLLGYHQAAVITGLLAVIPSSLAVKSNGGDLAVYTYFIVSIIFGYSISPLPQHFILPLSLFLLALMPCIRPFFFKYVANAQFIYAEAITYLIALSLFVLGNLHYGADWIAWTFPGIAFLFGLFLVSMFTLERLQIKSRIRDYFGVKPGDTAPDFTLTDQDGNKVSLSEYKGNRHVLIIFIRGDWCPTCHIMLRTYEKEKAKFAEKNIVLIAIGPDPLGVNKEMVVRLGLDYKLLSDDKNEAAKSYGMMFHSNNPDTKFQEGIPLPAAFLIDINGKVAYTTNPRIPGEMLTPQTIFPVVEGLKMA